MLFSCATALSDKQERSLSTGIQRSDFEHFYFDEGTASQSPLLHICK